MNRKYFRKKSDRQGKSKDYLDILINIFKAITLATAISGGVVAVLRKILEVNACSDFSLYYDIPFMYFFDGKNYILFYRIALLFIGIFYLMPSWYALKNKKYFHFYWYERFYLSMMAAVGVYLIFTSFGVEDLIYEHFPEATNTHIMIFYIIVSGLVFAWLFYKFYKLFKDKNRLIFSSNNVDRFANYYFVIVFIIGILGPSITYLSNPFYNRAKDVNTYPTLAEFYDEDDNFDVIIYKTDDSKAIAMPAFSEVDDDGCEIVVIKKGQFRIETLTGKDIVMRSFYRNELR